VDEQDALLEGDDQGYSDGGVVRQHTSRTEPHAVHEGLFEDCPRCNPPGAKVAAQFKGTLAERDELIASGDQGQYYAVSAKYGTLVSRAGRPVYATLAQWAQLDGSMPAAAYIPTTVTTTAKTFGPLFGSLPLLDTDSTPDIVGRLINLVGFFEKGAEMLGNRVEQLDSSLNARIHERELLARAADMIDPDSVSQLGGITHEQRLDWLAKWREVVS
jgi:hypothetical protein